MAEENITLPSLATDIQETIFLNLDAFHLCLCCGSCREFRRVINEALWQRWFIRRVYNARSLVLPPGFQQGWKWRELAIFVIENVDREEQSLLVAAVRASSVDRPVEALANTLTKSPCVEPELRLNCMCNRYNRSCYWSSTGSPDENSSEVLQYQLSSSVCVVRSIEIVVYNAWWHPQEPTYGPLFVRVSFGPSNDYQFGSVCFPLKNVGTSQFLEFDQPALVLGGFMRLELLGRQQRQTVVHPEDDYYTCLSYVGVYGLALEAMQAFQAAAPTPRVGGPDSHPLHPALEHAHAAIPRVLAPRGTWLQASLLFDWRVTTLTQCGVCGEPSALRCSRCKATTFCSADHQKAAWREHKSLCRQ